jgi:hypothetical protein
MIQNSLHMTIMFISFSPTTVYNCRLLTIIIHYHLLYFQQLLICHFKAEGLSKFLQKSVSFYHFLIVQCPEDTTMSVDHHGNPKSHITARLVKIINWKAMGRNCWWTTRNCSLPGWTLRQHIPHSSKTSVSAHTTT